MSEINSPLGRRHLAVPPPRILNVPDEAGLPLSEPQYAPSMASAPIQQKTQDELEASRKAATEARKRISPAAKERIEFLVGLGRAKTEVQFENVTFQLQSLKAGEMREVLYASSQCETNGDAMFAIRSYTLAYALEKIDNQSVGAILGNDSMTARLELINEMDEELIEFLHNNYNQMVKTNKNKFTVQTEKEAKGVAEDLKK